MTQLMIEAETGIPQCTISRRLKKPEIREIIERIQSELIQDTAEEVKTVITNLVKEYKDNTCKGKKREMEKEHAFRCVQRIAEMTGMFPSHTPSILIQQVFNEPDPGVTEEIQQLRAFLEEGWISDAIDVTPGETETT